jgi:alpha-tubulin suppressor-like RCC1 family protein
VVTTLAGGVGCCASNVDPAAFTAGGAHTCAVMGSSSNVFCWGSNASGQLGDNTTVERITPVRAGTLSGVVDVSGGGQHTCAVLQNGSVYCWGLGVAGQLGNGTLGNRLVPTLVTGLPAGATQISAGNLHTCATLTNGQVWCWGFNVDGRLGNNTTTASAVPVRVQGLTGAVEAGSGFAHSCARLSSGQVWCWGQGISGRLGNNAAITSLIPVQVSGLTDAKAIAVGSEHNCALRNAGNVVCWGYGLTGALGRNSILDSWFPVPVAAQLPAGQTVQIDVGDDFSCATTSGGKVYCWGLNNVGQSGTGALVPGLVLTLTDATAVSGGDLHACASKRDGSLSCWGSNLNHQLGVISLGGPLPVNLCQ